MRLTFRKWLSYQRKKQPPVVEADLTGKTVVVLGASTGLGLEAAIHFARMGAGRLILACRSEGRGKAAVEKVKTATSFANTIELWLVDLAEFASVKRFADRWDQEGGGRLDILVANATTPVTFQYEPTKDGFETMLQVSALSTPLVVLRLLPSLRKTAEEHGTAGRVVVVASDAHYMANIDKEVWKGDQIIGTLGSAEYHRKKGRSAMLDRYSVIKLMNIFFARALASRMPQSTPTVIVDTVNPGMCKTELNRDLPFPFGAIMSGAQRLIAFTAEEGSRQLVFAAVGEQKTPEALQGKFIMGGAPLEESDFVVREEGSKVEGRLWDEVVQILSSVDGKVQGIVEEYASH